MAEKDGMSSIAFPTIGCGKLGFDAKSVAHSFLQAQTNTQSTVQVGNDYFYRLLHIYHKTKEYYTS